MRVWSGGLGVLNEQFLVGSVFVLTVLPAYTMEPYEALAIQCDRESNRGLLHGNTSVVGYNFSGDKTNHSSPETTYANQFSFIFPELLVMVVTVYVMSVVRGDRPATGGAPELMRGDSCYDYDGLRMRGDSRPSHCVRYEVARGVGDECGVMF